MTCVLEQLPRLDWSDLESVGQITSQALRELCSNKQALRDLLEHARSDATLRAMAECHPLDDKIVLYDAMESQNFRVRLRLATAYQDERPHNHRFPFTTLVLRGEYNMTWYEATKPMDELIAPSDIVAVAVRHEPEGSASTIDHRAIHSTIATPECISVIMRGPAAKDKAFICHKDTGQIWTRLGAAQESSERRREVQMSDERFEFWVERLSAQGVI